MKKAINNSEEKIYADYHRGDNDGFNPHSSFLGERAQNRFGATE
ncbi:MAG TPA: hypothetical protein VJX74_19015 [Blastocatellia bacterium]|nr:hypothetical protein [Blastocatellia bacterium]